MKYIFLAGAPGSRWSSVAKHLYSSNKINTSDSSKSYTKPNESVPMHVGAYWDPGMGYGENFDALDILSNEYIEQEFDKPFKTSGLIKLIKSHQFSKHLEFIKNNWPYCPILIALRPDDVCYDWWLEAGGWDISYPSYTWYKGKMQKEIKEQNLAIKRFLDNNDCKLIKDTIELAEILDIEIPDYKNFEESDTQLYVYFPFLVEYFGKSWKGNLPKYKYSGLALLDKIDANSTVLDVGCGDNFFKSHFPNLIGIDPSNNKADIKVSIEEFDCDKKFDALLCLGSLNFGSAESVFAQCKKAVNLTNPSGTIYWRCNPGLHDHPHQGQERIDFFEWSFDLHQEWSKQLGCKLVFCEWDTDNRIYAEWKVL